MYQAEVARTHIDDLVRDADVYRRSKQARAVRAGETRGKLRRVVTGAVSLVMWPIKH